VNAVAKIAAAPDPEGMPHAQLCAALARALPKLGAVHRNKKNPAFKSNYADIAAVIGALAPLAEDGLWFRQVPVEHTSGVAMETIYIHESGAEMSAGITVVPVDKVNAHGIGSAQTYCRRYALITAFGLATDDDDGNAAVSAAPKAQSPNRVSGADVALIIQLCEAVGGSQAALICKAYNIGSLPDLTESQGVATINRLKEKLAERAKTETDQEAANA
jgi:ERF superfamily